MSYLIFTLFANKTASVIDVKKNYWTQAIEFRFRINAS